MEIPATDIILFNEKKKIKTPQPTQTTKHFDVCFPYFIYWYGIGNTFALQQGFNVPRELCSLLL